MNKKEIIQGFSVLEKILKGAKQANDLITSTMGPGGNLVCIRDKYKIRSTKDGATVAQNLTDVKDPVESIGVKLVTQASKDMSDRVGDGSTTVVCLLYNLMRASLDLMRSGYTPNEIISVMQKFKDLVAKTIESIHKPITADSKQMHQIATIAANGDEKIGSFIAEMLAKLGQDSAIIAEESITGETHIDVKEGFYFNKGVAGAGFFKSEEQERMKIELDSPFVLIIGQKLTSLAPLMPLIQHVVQMGKPLLIIADDVDNDVANTLAFNRNLGKVNVIVTKADGFGDQKMTFMEDAGIFTGASLVSDAHNNFHNLNIEVLGSAKKIQITKDNTVIMGSHGNTDLKQQRISIIKAQIQQATSDYDKEKLQKRLAKLASGIGTIYVGGQTDLEIKELKDRVEDAIHACKNALKGGVVPGAGTELMYAANSLYDDENLLMRKFAEVLDKPLKTIVKNSCMCSSDVVIAGLKQQFKNGNYEAGFNGTKGQISNLIEDGILNPKLVSLTALDIAVSNCKTYVKLNAVILEVPTESKINEDAYAE